MFDKKAARTVTLVKDPNGTSAVNLSKVREAGHIDLAKKADKAGISLNKRGLEGIRAQAFLVLDYSYSMLDDYRNGNVQTLVERALGFALQIDLDGEVPVIPFASQALPTIAVNLNNYQGVVDRELVQKHRMGSTDLAGGLQVVLDAAKTTDSPIFCIVVTDGAPDSKPAAVKVVAEMSKYPVFIKFLALNEIEFLRKLDDDMAGKSLIDNVDTKFSSGDLDLLGGTDLKFADAMTDEWDTWIKAAFTAGVLR
jgi:von Willebrand factor type A domain.